MMQSDNIGNDNENETIMTTVNQNSYMENTQGMSLYYLNIT